MSTLHGFEILQESDVPEIKSHIVIYRHIKSGAELVSVTNDDDNKCFGISFATPPPDSTGIAHIMEHSVLCGSRKYPLKEPFIELAKGSLNTFLNAMTFPDKTVYPVASQNVQDLYNLMDVYLDSVLYPNISEHTLAQEGWHYELDSVDGQMNYKGVVFNEMKGNYSSPDTMLYFYTLASLFPDSPYGYDHGGDPKVIPSLTYDQFKRFHEVYYHPSNARLWCYGNDDPERRLAYLDGWLSAFERIQVDAGIAPQPRFSAPRRATYGYDAGGDENAKSMITVNWMLGESSDVRETAVSQMLNRILIGTPASPLRKALIDSGLGEDLAGGGLADDTRQHYFSVGLKGVNADKLDAVEPLIQKTLEVLAKDGIDAETIEAAMNATEFSLREMNTGRFPRGLALMFSSLSTWLYGGDPVTPLRYEAPLAAIKADLAAGKRVFEDVIREKLLNNPHKVTIVLQPDAAIRAKDDAEERAKLDKARAAMSSEQVQRVVEETAALKLAQETPDTAEVMAMIPSLKLSDIEPKIKTTPTEVSRSGKTDIVTHNLFTNGIAYIDLGFNLLSLPSVAVPYIGLLSRMLLDMGTDTESFVQLSQRIDRKTGGVHGSTLNSIRQDGVSPAAWFFLRAKATVTQTDDLLAVLRDVLLHAKLDNRERFKQIVLEDKARTESGLVPSGHAMVNYRVKSHFTSSDWADEQINGVSSLFFLRELSEEIDRDWAGVLARLEFVRRQVINRNAMTVNVTLDDANLKTVQPKLIAMLDELPAAPWGPLDWPAGQFAAEREALTIPSQVNYVAKGAPLYKYGYTLHGSVMVIGQYLRTTYLWDRVRVQGGAYGGFNTFDQRSGMWTFLSYRDPNLLKTLDVYDNAGAFLRNPPSKEEVEKCIIGVIGQLDGYELPDARGYTALQRHLLGVDDAWRQSMRDQVLSTTPADFAKFADMLDAVRDHGHIAVLGSAAAADTANAARGGLLTSIKVM